MQFDLLILTVAGALGAALGAGLLAFAWLDRRHAQARPGDAAGSAAIGHVNAADTDLLTDLPNRAGFLRHCERFLARCGRDGSPVTAIVFDIDHFRAINDTFGQTAGDRTLKIFADAARAQLRPDNVIGRVGGEEFAAFLPRTRAEAAEPLAERVRHAFADAVSAIDGLALSATVSAGVASAPAGAEALDALLARADAALRLAKRNGRNRIERADDDEQQDPSRLAPVA